MHTHTPHITSQTEHAISNDYIHTYMLQVDPIFTEYHVYLSLKDNITYKDTHTIKDLKVKVKSQKYFNFIFIN